MSQPGIGKSQLVVVTHQHSGDPAITWGNKTEQQVVVVTHQHSGDPAISSGDV